MFSNFLHQLFNFLNILKKYGLNAQWVKKFTIYLNEDMEKNFFNHGLGNGFITERSFFLFERILYNLLDQGCSTLILVQCSMEICNNVLQ